MLNIITTVKSLCEDNPEAYSFIKDYSGRGMRDKTCVAVVCGDPFEFISALIERCLDSVEFSEYHLYTEYEGFVDSITEVKILLNNSKTDSLGKQTIIYWSKETWEEP